MPALTGFARMYRIELRRHSSSGLQKLPNGVRNNLSDNEYFLLYQYEYPLRSHRAKFVTCFVVSCRCTWLSIITKASILVSYFSAAACVSVRNLILSWFSRKTILLLLPLTQK